MRVFTTTPSFRHTRKEMFARAFLLIFGFPYLYTKDFKVRETSGYKKQIRKGMAFPELEKYDRRGSFTFRCTDRLENVCNAPHDCGGIYLVYDLSASRPELIYIGRSGQIKDSEVSIRKGGIRDRLINGKQGFGQQPDRAARKKAWPRQMLVEGITALRVDWFVTLTTGSPNDCPFALEKALLASFESKTGGLPRWNRR